MTSDYANQNHCNLKVGDKVLISTTHINNLVDSQHPIKKFSLKYLGPYKVIEYISPIVYKLKLPTLIKIHSVVQVSVLKPYHEKSEFSQPVPLPPEIIDNKDEFEVECILDKRIQYHKLEYLIK